MEVKQKKCRECRGPHFAGRKATHFRMAKGHWYSLCKPCEKAVLRYRKGGSCALMHPPMICGRCGKAADVEFYPLFAKEKP